MIGKGKAIAHTRASMNYGWNQEKNAEVVFRQHLAGEDPAEITQEFRFVQQQNADCHKNTLSFVLSPTVEDGKSLSTDDLEELSARFIKQMNLKERQAIGFVHRDKEHLHVHLYVNRIDFNGNAYNDSFIGKRSQEAAERVAQQMNLTTVRQVQLEKRIELAPIRAEIKRRHDITMERLRPKTFDQYIKGMASNGVKVIPSINKANKLQGFRFEYGGHNLKGSEVHRSMTGGNIGKELAGSHGQEKFLKEHASMKMMGKVVQLSDRLTLSITKQVIKRIISRGLEY